MWAARAGCLTARGHRTARHRRSDLINYESTAMYRRWGGVSEVRGGSGGSGGSGWCLNDG